VARREFPQPEATPEAIADALRPETFSYTSPFTWEQALAIGERQGMGQITTPEDWSHVPRNATIRVVAFPGPPVTIRWATDKAMERIFSSASHEYFRCRGDPPFGWSGYVRRTRDNHIQV
jgi:hypothetical protein